jgi:hypothetical protein
MKIFSTILTLFICVFLFASSCDLLTTDEEEKVDYIEVTVYLEVCTETPESLSEPSINIQIKIYKEGISINEKINTGESGCTTYQTETYHMRKGETFTASAYLVDFPDVYKTQSITFEESENKAIDNGGKAKSFSWTPLIKLMVP